MQHAKKGSVILSIIFRGDALSDSDETSSTHSGAERDTTLTFKHISVDRLTTISSTMIDIYKTESKLLINIIYIYKTESGMTDIYKTDSRMIDIYKTESRMIDI